MWAWSVALWRSTPDHKVSVYKRRGRRDFLYHAIIFLLSWFGFRDCLFVPLKLPEFELVWCESLLCVIEVDSVDTALNLCRLARLRAHEWQRRRCFVRRSPPIHSFPVDQVLSYFSVLFTCLNIRESSWCKFHVQLVHHRLCAAFNLPSGHESSYRACDELLLPSNSRKIYNYVWTRPVAAAAL